jgi:poly(ribitol-phosphate) beta-N-acetylglucosaminyltransferase
VVGYLALVPRAYRDGGLPHLLKVSVIVPVYNPGNNIDECISSLLGQSLPEDEYELIFVDDGSTDETPARLDELAAEHTHVRVEHTPNSGWPGRPRNIGLDMARGEFVYFVDNDDWVARGALERLHKEALRHESDIVIGKVVGHGKLVPRTLFRRNRSEVTLDWPPLLRLLTPHKLFRRSLLDEHGIRFPEGRRRLEDHAFTVHAFFHASRISVLANYACYHWMMRDTESGANVSYTQFDPVGYFENVREVLDIVEHHTEPGPLRDKLLSHWYRGKMLGRVGGVPFLNRNPDYNRLLYEEIRRLALERYGPSVEEWLPFNLRPRSRLLRGSSYESLETLASFEAGLRADNQVHRLDWGERTLALRFEAALVGEPESLEFARRGSRMVWVPPESLRGELSEMDLDVTDDLPKANVDLMLRARRDRSEFVVKARSALLMLRAGADSDAKRPALNAAAEIDVTEAAAGARLPRGQWGVHAIVNVAGWNAIAPVMTVSRRWLRRRPEPLTFVATRDGRLLRHPPLRRRVARRFPRLVGILRRARRRAAARGKR